MILSHGIQFIDLKNFVDCKIFYNKKEYKQAIKEENNDLEKKWKSNILYKNTPRGNILMYYDAFKLGFVYTCDTSVSYDILNALAMKYVTEFRCLDFFFWCLKLAPHVQKPHNPS